LLHQVGDLFELNVKLRCQKVKYMNSDISGQFGIIYKEQLCYTEEDYCIEYYTTERAAKATLVCLSKFHLFLLNSRGL
jgi:hypothetical protein